MIVIVVLHLTFITNICISTFGYIGSKLVVLWFYTRGSIYNKEYLLNSHDPSTTLVLSKFTHLLSRMLKGLCYLSVNSFYSDGLPRRLVNCTIMR